MILSHISRRKHGKTHHFSPPMKMFRSRVGAGSRGLPAPQRRLALCAWLCGWSQGLKWAVFTRKNGYGSVWVMRIDWNNCLMMLSKVGFIWFYVDPKKVWSNWHFKKRNTLKMARKEMYNLYLQWLDHESLRCQPQYFHDSTPYYLIYGNVTITTNNKELS